MNFFRYITSFLYVRNWHTGKKELSQRRVLAFVLVMFLVILATVIILVLQTPVSYERA
jgi:type IV secretory pathway component VirB8